jgi:hypothetical protein
VDHRLCVVSRLPEDVAPLSAETCRSKIDILNIWFTLKKNFVGLSFIMI